ncbi:ABC transporter permease [Streptococcus panodentis]|uniref:Lantibiotic ABC transporter permease n=1 Tax=Streptococcus panodentis TaxID=1581472 RepID=A0ABS5ATS1_9STRE|nr:MULTISPECIES: ABC transporter permease [Streptococcus]KXT85739.1 hypothetical protein STRDD11_00231 [Streptococcus sp. DD11]MBP2619974.1 lantibiotic ABC transporter permease [Streptococcus panodentis]
MLHTIQAELYQLVRSKLFWLIEGLLFFLIFINSLGERNFNFYISTSSDPEEIVIQGWTGFEALGQLAKEFLPFVMITVLVLIISLLGRDLTRKLYNNILAGGISRKEFYLSKIAVLITIIILQMAAAFAVAFIFGSLFHGLGTMPKNFLWSFSLSFFRSFLFIMTCSSVVTCLLYLTRSTLASYLVFFALIMLQSSLVIVFPQINSELFLLFILAGSLLGGYQAFHRKDL